MLKTAEQRRAEKTWECLQQFGADPSQWAASDKEPGKYLNALRQTAARIHVSGLGQSLAFLNSRKGAPSKLAARDLSRLVLAEMGLQANGAAAASTLIGTIRNGDIYTLMRATEEALAVIAWMSRYLQGAGVKPVESDDAEGDPEDG